MCDRDVSKDVTCAPDDYTANLMTQIVQLEADVKRLQAENTDLHEEMAEWHGRALGFKYVCESLINVLYDVAKD